MPATKVTIPVGNLPAEVNSFVGRRREAAELKRLLESSRLVTVTGIGGLGKTRLALKVALEARRAFPGGVWFVDLSALQDPGQLAEEVGVALGLRDQSGRQPSATLIEYLTDKHLLLVLDNCEHLIAACGVLLAGLLRSAPDVRVLATSRQPLGIAGEHVLNLAALSLPDPDLPPPPPTALAQYEALTLFVERAQAATSTFSITPENQAAVIELCRSLDGMPLALELAAVRLRFLSPEQLLARMDDRFHLLTGVDTSIHPRQRSLQSLIDWSYELCSPAERTLWARLAVFPAVFDVDAAAGVCADDQLDSDSVLNALAGLVERSLVATETSGRRMRYRLLETVREYGLARLVDSADHAARQRRHRDYFRQLAELAEAAWCSQEQRDWTIRLREEHANLRAALTFSLSEPGEERAALELAGTLRLHWLLSGYLSEGRQWLGRALDAVPDQCEERAKALWADAYLRLNQGDIPGAESQLQLSLEIAQALGDEAAYAHATELQGMAALLSSRWDAATVSSEEAIGRHRATGDRFGVVMALARSAMAHHMGGDIERALDRYAAALAESEICEESWGRASILWIHGVMLFDQKDLDGAEASVRESLRIRVSFGDRLGMARSVEVLAWIEAGRGQYERAARLIGVAETVWRSTGGKFFAHVRDRDDRCRSDTIAGLGEKAFASTVEDGARMGADDGLAFALGAPVARSRTASPGGESAKLTRRESEIAELVAEGLTNRDIAARLVLSQRTADSHVEHILSKLGFNTRAQIAAWVVENRDRS
jgi:predicted ATPase/DNA-binding CsgD family transcriptional regulator